ncbi:MAG: VCBS domain-containing protein [Telluria sp.]
MAASTSTKVAVNTGAAKDDLFTAADGITEDSLVAQLNVLANDPGSAKLYSFANPGQVISTSTTFVPLSSSHSALGATLTLNADGTVRYDASSLSASMQSLAAGEYATDSFSYVIRMANGALSTATVTVQIGGQNDAPTLKTVADATLYDTAADDTPAAITGTLQGADVDHGSTLTYHLVSGSSAYGTLAVGANGSYSFLADADKIDSLNAGENATASFVVNVTDEHGAASAPVTLNFKLIGANDIASISGTASGAGTEDSAALATGMLTVADRDAGQSVFAAPSGLAGAYGDFTFDAASGAWTYAVRNSDNAVQALNAGKIVHDAITVSSLDGTATQTIDVAITGTNDAASISGTAAGAVTEDGTAAAGATLTVADVDSGEAVFKAAPSLAGAYGDFTFDVATGTWGYLLRNGDANVQALNGGKVVHDSITVSSLDGTATQTIDVAITGTNDAATISGTAAGAVTEDGAAAAGATLTVADVDSGEAVFQAAPSLAGAYGDFTFDAATGAWGYLLRNGDANVQALNGGKVVHDSITVSSLDGTATQTIDVAVTGTNDAASISGTASGAVAEDGTAAAAGTLAVSDADSGEAGFKAAGSLAGTYGDFSFDAAAGTWGYTLHNGAANVQALGATALVHDQLVVTSLDGSASQTIDVAIAGANDAATFSGATTGNVKEDANLTTGGTLSVADVDTGEAGFQAATGLAGAYGDFTFDAGSGAWTYTLRNGAANVQALNTGDVVVDTLTVKSVDGTAQDIKVSISGQNEPALPPQNPNNTGDTVTRYLVNHGTTDINERNLITGFDANDLLVYANNLTLKSITQVDTNGDHVADATDVQFTFHSNTIDVVLVGFTGLQSSQVVGA